MKNMIKKAATVLAVAISAVGPLAVTDTAMATTFIVSYESEAPGAQTTSATFSTGGVENFDILPVGHDSNFSTNFGTSGKGSTITGNYTADSSNGIQINSADQYGGAGGAGHYAVAFQNTPYSLTLTSNVKGGVNYFGFWLSALDKGNFVTFYGSNGQVLFTFNPQDAIKAIDSSSNAGSYYGNPNAPFKGQDSSEPFVFLNFFDTTGTFSKITFDEVGFGGGYESDNHTVGHYISMGTGTLIPLHDSVMGNAPEISTWVMMLMGFAGVAFVARRRVRISA